MKYFSCLLTLIATCLLNTAHAAPNQSSALLLTINGAISPSTQDYVHRGLKQAAQQHASVVILQIDTPGGLDKSMRGIVQNILASPVPVATYVAPSGARAASAGTFILYASHIAAMAPGTNLGAASPISISGSNLTFDDNKNKSHTTLETKATNDASAYIRSLAELRNRNVNWAEQAVRSAVSLSADEALKLKVVDIVAKDITSLLTKINGHSVLINGEPQKLQTKNLTVTTFASDWRTSFLNIITDPNVAYMLLILGIWGIFFEFAHPGFLLPGVTGIIAIVVALYAFQLLPINYAGLGLILIGIAFISAEAFLPSYGALGIGGIIAFILGSILLLGTGTPGFAIALPLIFSISIISAAFFLTVINIAIKARLRPVVSGREELIGHTVTVIRIDEQHQAWTRIHGELWQVKSDTALRAGQKVKITNMEGNMLTGLPK